MKKTNNESTNTNKWVNILKQLNTVTKYNVIDKTSVNLSNETVQILCEKVRCDEKLTDVELKMYGEIADKAQDALFHPYDPNLDIFECDICGGEDCKYECVNM